MYYAWTESPVGRLLLAGTDALSLIAFSRGPKPTAPKADWRSSDAPFLRQATAQIEEYFQGTRREFDLDLAPTGTPFQLAVLDALATIPYGETRSYGEVAAQIGKPKAVRAVGAANGRNPLPIVLPCHRVIGADGSLTGFGGGLETKRYLLELEGSRC
ncbi:MAG: methylated-DNA--[protein]-cysteine S-methyltransferase [Gammaproteobacteria bacterium]|nr:methylated-DNA--[protein]-cysteine S-methyltransferase [Gammaproteobacteria bacterium]MDE0452614.1 methylated-DNA--[protein]-cysteine S-methyltransferase [Gammaproteobacteria bacterium]